MKNRPHERAIPPKNIAYLFQILSQMCNCSLDSYFEILVASMSASAKIVLTRYDHSTKYEESTILFMKNLQGIFEIAQYCSRVENFEDINLTPYRKTTCNVACHSVLE